MLHIHTPRHFAGRRLSYCRTCRKKRRVVALHAAWYEPLAMCTGCGEDPRTERRRFTRVSPERKRKIEKAKSLYATATSEVDAIRAMMEDAT